MQALAVQHGAAMIRTFASLVVSVLLGLGLWLLLPMLAGALGQPGLAHPGARAALGIALAALAQAFLQGGQLARLRAEVAALRHSVEASDNEVSWARRELAGLVDSLRAHRASSASEPERVLNEARAEVELLQHVVTQLDGPGGEEPSEPIGPALRVDMPGVDQKAVLAAVREALKHDRIELVVQPIVSLPQRRRRFYECFSRLRDVQGGLLLPEAYIPVAERAGLMGAVDNMLLLRCMQIVRRIQRKGEHLAFVCNLSPYTLRSPQFFGDFVKYLDANAELASSLVFEIGLADFEELEPEAEVYLSRLWHLGARISIDAVHSLAFDPVRLAERHVDFVKIPAAALLDRPRQSVIRVRENLAKAEIDLIVEKIESDAELVELLEFDPDFGQGFLFGEPRPARLAS